MIAEAIDPSKSARYTGDCRELLRRLPDGCVQTCVTSPPYWGLRDYGHEGQIGLEETPELFVAELVRVFREVRRVLRDDGTLWLNLGDCYASSGARPIAMPRCGSRAAQRAIRSRCQRSVPALAWWPSPAPSFPSEQPRPAVRFCLGAR